MLIRPHDAGSDEEQWRKFVTSVGFGHFAVRGSGPIPVIVPTQFVLGEADVLFHLASPNPVFAALDATPCGVLSLAGDWAYIPGAWKMVGDEDPSRGIPTTYYASVQISGAVEVTDDDDEIAAILLAQTQHLEPAGGLVHPLAHRKRFRSIRGIRLSIDDVRSKFKFGGNVDVEHRQAVAARLRDRDGPGDAAAAARIPGLELGA